MIVLKLLNNKIIIFLTNLDVVFKMMNIRNVMKFEIVIPKIQGRQLAQPLAEYKSAGFHQLNFNYEHVPNGLYIIKFTNDYQTFTVKSI